MPVMNSSFTLSSRRNFLGATAATVTAGVCASLLPAQPAQAADATDANVLGPRPGYSLQIGVFVSQLTWMREANGVLSATKGQTQPDLDVLFDQNANTIGALMLHLGDAGRKTIKGHDRQYYVDILHEVREKTLAEFRKRDDTWLLAVDKTSPWGPTNNLCKWFHVCEHEAHHTGQIALLRKRLPGAKPDAS